MENQGITYSHLSYFPWPSEWFEDAILDQSWLLLGSLSKGSRLESCKGKGLQKGVGMTRKNLARESSLNGSYRLSSQIEPRSQYQLVNPKITKLPLPFFVQEVRDKNVAIVRMLASLDLGYQLPSEEKLHDGMPGPFWNQPQYLFLALLIGLIIICFFSHC